MRPEPNLRRCAQLLVWALLSTLAVTLTPAAPASAGTTVTSPTFAFGTYYFTGDETWTLAGSPYYVTENLLFQGTTSSLTIEAGVEVIVDEGKFMTFEGDLDIAGSYSDEVSITSADPDKYWGGISFPGSGEVNIQHARIDRAGTLNTCLASSGIFDFPNSSSKQVFMADSTLAYPQRTLISKGGSTSSANLTFLHNDLGVLDDGDDYDDDGDGFPAPMYCGDVMGYGQYIGNNWGPTSGGFVLAAAAFPKLLIYGNDFTDGDTVPVGSGPIWFPAASQYYPDEAVMGNILAGQGGESVGDYEAYGEDLRFNYWGWDVPPGPRPYLDSPPTFPTGNGTFPLQYNARVQPAIIEDNGVFDLYVDLYAVIGTARVLVQDPVDAVTGNYVEARTDLALPAQSPLGDWTRTYNSLDGRIGVVGAGWSTPLDIKITTDSPDEEFANVTVQLADGHTAQFINIDSFEWLRPPGVFGDIAWESDHWEIDWVDGRHWVFDADNRIESFADWQGRTSTVDWQDWDEGTLTVTGSSGYGLSITGTDGVIDTVTPTFDAHPDTGPGPDDQTDAQIAYTYNTVGDAPAVAALATVTRGTGEDAVVEWTYLTDDDRDTGPDSEDLVGEYYRHRGLITEVQDALGRTMVINQYQDWGRVVHQWTPAPEASANDWAETSYHFTDRGRVVRVVDEATGDDAVYLHDSQGRVSGIVDTTDHDTARSFDGAGNLTTVVDRSGNTATADFDDDGHRIERTDFAGNEATAEYTDGRLTSATRTVDGETATTTYTYDEPGDRIPHEIIGPEQDATHRTVIDLDGQDRIETITDADGVVTAYGYDDNDNLTTVTVDPGGGAHLNLVTTTTYDELGRVESIEGPDGRITTYVPDAAGRVTSVTEEGEDPTVAAYNDDGTIDQVTDPLGAVTTFAYDPATGDRIEQTQIERVIDGATAPEPVEFTTTSTYNDVGELTEQTRPGDLTHAPAQSPPSTQTTNLGALGRTEETVTTGGGLDRSVAYTYDANGNQTATTVDDGDSGLETSVVYDDLSRPITITNPAGGDTTTAYNEVGLVHTTTDPTDRVARSHYDTAGQLVETELVLPAEPDDLEITSETREYTPAGRLHRVINGEGDVVEYGYDAAGRLNQVTLDPDGTEPLTTTSQTTYGTDTQTTTVTSPEGRAATTVVTFDDGERIETTTHDGQVADTVRRFNWRDELTEQARVTADTVVHGDIHYLYDDRGNLAAVQDANDNWVTYSYDGRGNRLTRTSDPGDGPLVERWEYNAADQVTLAADPLDRETSYLYDDAGRLDLVTDPSGRSRDFGYRDDGAIASIVYDDGTDTVETIYDYDDAGRPISAEIDGGAGATTYEFDDPYGGMTHVAYPGGDDISVQYDLAGRRSSVTYPDDTETTYTYDSYGRPATVVDDDLGTTTYTWDGDGNLLEEAMPDDQYRRWARDPDTGWVELYDTVIDGTRHTSAVANDPFGRLQFDATDGDATTYGYDDADQLISVHHSDSIFDATITGDDVAYTYDGVGNRRTRAQGPPGGPGSTLETYAYDDANQLVAMTSDKGSTAYDYDAAGRLVAYGDDANDDLDIDATPAHSTDLIYDPRGLPEEIVTVDGATTVTEDRTYDATGTLTEQAFSGPSSIAVEHVWDPTTPVPQVLQLTAAGDPTRLVYGPTGLPGGAADRIGAVGEGPTEAYFATDAGGSVIGTDGSPTLAQASDYDEWGNPTGPDINPNPDWVPALGYRGELQSSAGVHLRNRDYLPAAGVFTTPDPLDGLDGTSTVANRYPYSGSSPTNLTDPLGLRPGDGALTDGLPGAQCDAVSGHMAWWGGTGNRVCLQPPASQAEGESCWPPLSPGGLPLVLHAGSCQVLADQEFGCARLGGFRPLDWVCEHREGVLQVLEAVALVAGTVASVGAGLEGIGVSVEIGGSRGVAYGAEVTSNLEAEGATILSESAGAGAGDLPPAVIGEGMSSRVVPFAEANGYETYAGLENPQNYTSEELLAHNRAQIETWGSEGRMIYDVGPEPGRAFYPMETSPNYGMEHNLVRGYAGYRPIVLPGETNWWEALLVP